MTPDDEPRSVFVLVRELSRENISDCTIYRWIRTGIGPGIKLATLATGLPFMAEPRAVQEFLRLRDEHEQRKRPPSLPQVSGPIGLGTPLLELVSHYREKRLIRSHPAVLRRYVRSVVALQGIIGRPATVADLTEDNLQEVEFKTRAKKVSEATVKEYRRHLQQLWNFAFRRGAISSAPDLPPLRIPDRTPFAWSREQLTTLFRAVDSSPYQITFSDGLKVPFRVWLRALLLVMWDTAERVGACLKLRWKHLDQSSGWIHIPAELRKWQTADMAFRLHPETMRALKSLRAQINREPESLIFPWPMTEGYLWFNYRKILRAAGLPVGRKQMFHAIRRTVASHLELVGVDASRVLGHSDPQTTAHYISPAIVEPPPPATVLPRPN